MDALRAALETIAPLPPAEWALTTAAFRQRQLAKGEFFVAPGAHSHQIAFVESGLFRLYYALDGTEKTMLFFSEGQFMTDFYGYLTQTPSVRPIQALEAATLYVVERQQLTQLYQASHTWNTLGRVLAERAYLVAVQRANRLLHDDPDTRFQTLLAEHPGLLQRVPQYLIASYLDMTPETLSRVKRRVRLREQQGQAGQPRRA